MELFGQTSNKSSPETPLADRMRPRNLDEYAGQDHIVGPGRLLRRVIQADQLSSLIFYGPPGTGKTTLARVIAGSTSSHFITLNAVLSGVKQLRESIEEARQKRQYYGQKTILFIDEVHRWNKAQQDALLPWVENGTVVLIGATTENPYFEVNSALVSRSRIFQLKSLTEDDLRKILHFTLSEKERGYGRFKVSIDKEAEDHLVQVASGDARTLLNALELAVETTPESFPPPEDSEIHINLETAEESIQRKALLYDKEGDYHFDTISAFIKSVRGSDPDAALYWMARMVKAGEDPRFIFRRMLISACEDVGLADPNALVVVEAAAAAFDRVGLPEGQFHLTHAVLYLATAPKSNSALGYFEALHSLESEKTHEVPNHLRDASRDAKGFGHGEGYKYPHAYRDHWVAQAYLPADLSGRVFYSPSDQGYEGSRKPLLEKRREEQLAGAMEEPPEILTYSPGDKSRKRWADRTENGAADFQRSLRDKVFSALPLQRHWRILDIAPGSGIFMTEALRSVPEGQVVVCEPSEKKRNMLIHMAEQLSLWEQPLILNGSFPEPFENKEAEWSKFELITGRDLMLTYPDREKMFSQTAGHLKPGGYLAFADTVPSEGIRLSAILEESGLDKETFGMLMDGENRLYADPDNRLTNWNSQTPVTLLENAGFTDIAAETVTHSFEIELTPSLLGSWFSPDSASYATRLTAACGKDFVQSIQSWAYENIAGRRIIWKRTYLLCRAQFR